MCGSSPHVQAGLSVILGLVLGLILGLGLTPPPAPGPVPSRARPLSSEGAARGGAVPERGR